MIKNLLFLLVSCLSSAQVLHHQTLAAQSSSVLTSKGISVRQSIGQQSVAGTVTHKGYVVQQGFQQSLFTKYNSNFSNLDIVTKVYPNPFISVINFDFSSEINDEIEVGLFDDLGRSVFSTKEILQQNHLTVIPPANLTEGHYVLILHSKNFKYSVQLIKSHN